MALRGLSSVPRHRADSSLTKEEPGWREIRLKRVYEKPAPDDGLRVLVERLWPRGLSKERAAVDLWIKDVAPSPELAGGLTMIRPGGANSKNATVRNSGRTRTWSTNCGRSAEAGSLPSSTPRATNSTTAPSC